MAKRLILIAITMLGLAWCNVAESKVCRLGDPGCEANAFFGNGDNVCDSSYKPCDDPRAGATYCYGKPSTGGSAQQLYRDEDCCSSLVGAYGYQECPIDEGLAGYGRSCLGAASNVRYWQNCGCSYGFVEVENGAANGDVIKDINGDVIEKFGGGSLDYSARCSFADWGVNQCRLSQCNAERRFFYTDSGGEDNYCKYRLDTQCGGFGCKQVYDCNHDEIDTGKEYYRNENHYLATGVENFLPYSAVDPVTNERLADGTVALITALKNNDPITNEDYNVVNRYVCSYKQRDGSYTDYDVSDDGLGFNCNSVQNYCYLWKGCNEDRRWFNSDINAGIIYDGLDSYEIWMDSVERVNGYHPETLYPLGNPMHSNFYAVVNPNYGVYTNPNNTIDAINGSNCPSEYCRIVNANNGCTYVVGDCHQDGNMYRSHRCWKKISCTEENRFYHSFINAANYDAATGTQKLYNTSLNAPYFADFYAGLDPAREIYPACIYEINECNDATGCYRKPISGGCATNFEDIRDHINIEIDWEPWFKDIRPLCNDGTRCYQATACELAMGSYSSRPNTSFFVTISSTATRLTCYKGKSCRFEAGAYSSTPNTSFFSVINSSATGSVCYRGQSCHFEAGAYSSSPNTSFFNVITSSASGSICYRGLSCKDIETGGAYSSSPNTSFFYVVNSSASGSVCYRGQECHSDAGAYTTSPNTSFFVTISSNASGSTCYRGQSCFSAAGAYSFSPSTSFFVTISSSASDSTCYRGQSCNTGVGAYSFTPNTSFFVTAHSAASGSHCWRGINCSEGAGSYSSSPNTSFFVVIQSSASGSTCYRGQECNTEVGAYTSTPNTSFFYVANSHTSGSRCYRGTSCNTDAGAYSFSPDDRYFITVSSLASTSECWRATGCDFPQGAYNVTPSTLFFVTSASQASGSTCWRAESCAFSVGAYSETPNTSFFITSHSAGSGSHCWRAKGCHFSVGAYTSTPNTSFFLTSTSQGSGSTCYRATACNTAAGAYTATPDARYFVTAVSEQSSSHCWRAESCAFTLGAYTSSPNTSFFYTSYSQASSSHCYRGEGCNLLAGAYSFSPNAIFFLTISSEATSTTCWRATDCNIGQGSYSFVDPMFFTSVSSSASSSICYRATGCNTPQGAYAASPNPDFFTTVSSEATSRTCWRATGCSEDEGRGGHTFVDPVYFYTVSSDATSLTCYRATSCNSGNGAYSFSPNATFFITTNSTASGSTCWRAEGCNTTAGSESTIDTSYFVGIQSQATSLTCYRATACNLGAGAYSSSPNTTFFIVNDKNMTGKTCYRASACKISAGSYSSVGADYFYTISSKASGSTCYRATACIYCTYGAQCNLYFFVTSKSSATSQNCQRAWCNAATGNYSVSPNTEYFNVLSSDCCKKTCYRVQDSPYCATTRGAYSSVPNTTFFKTSNSQATGFTCYRADSCNTDEGSYASFSFCSPDSDFFNSISSASSTTCYRATSCKYCDYPTTCDTSYFDTYDCEATSIKCQKAKCRFGKPDKEFFLTTDTSCCSQSCNVITGCVQPNAASCVNTSFFVTSKGEWGEGCPDTDPGACPPAGGVTAEYCAAKCQNTGAFLKNCEGVSYYSGCVGNKCPEGSTCDGNGNCNCTYTTTQADCDRQCLNVGAKCPTGSIDNGKFEKCSTTSKCPSGSTCDGSGNCQCTNTTDASYCTSQCKNPTGACPAGSVDNGKYAGCTETFCGERETCVIPDGICKNTCEWNFAEDTCKNACTPATGSFCLKQNDETHWYQSCGANRCTNNSTCNGSGVCSCSTTTYPETAETCANKCSTPTGASCTGDDGVTRYASCSASTCTNNSKCNGSGKCTCQAPYTTAEATCVNGCFELPTDKCVDYQNKVFYASCPTSKCTQNNQCNGSGKCVCNATTYPKTEALCAKNCLPVIETPVCFDEVKNSNFYTACGNTYCDANEVCKIGTDTVAGVCGCHYEYTKEDCNESCKLPSEEPLANGEDPSCDKNRTTMYESCGADRGFSETDNSCYMQCKRKGEVSYDNACGTEGNYKYDECGTDYGYTETLDTCTKKCQVGTTGKDPYSDDMLDCYKDGLQYYSECIKGMDDKYTNTSKPETYVGPKGYYETGTDTLCTKYQYCDTDTGACKPSCTYTETAETCNAQCKASPVAGSASCVDDRNGDGVEETYYASCGADLGYEETETTCRAECSEPVKGTDPETCTIGGVTYYPSCSTGCETNKRCDVNLGCVCKEEFSLTADDCAQMCMSLDTSGENCTETGETIAKYSSCGTTPLWSDAKTEASCAETCQELGDNRCTTEAGVRQSDTCKETDMCVANGLNKQCPTGGIGYPHDLTKCLCKNRTDIAVSLKEDCEGECRVLGNEVCEENGVKYYECGGHTDTSDWATEEDCARGCYETGDLICTLTENGTETDYFNGCGVSLCDSDTEVCCPGEEGCDADTGCGCPSTWVTEEQCRQQCLTVNKDGDSCVRDGVTYYPACESTGVDGYDETEETCRAKCLGVNDDALNKCSPDANTTWYKQCGAAIYDEGNVYDKTADDCAGQCREILDETLNKCSPEGSTDVWYKECGNTKDVSGLKTEDLCASECKDTLGDITCTMDDVSYYNNCSESKCTEGQVCVDGGCENFEYCCGVYDENEKCEKVEGYEPDKLLTDCTKYQYYRVMDATKPTGHEGNPDKQCGFCGDCSYGTCETEAVEADYILEGEEGFPTNGQDDCTPLDKSYVEKTCSGTEEGCSNKKYAMCSDCKYTCTGDYSLDIGKTSCKTDVKEFEIYSSVKATSTQTGCVVPPTCGLCTACNYSCPEGYTLGLTEDDCKEGEDYTAGDASSSVEGCGKLSDDKYIKVDGKDCGKCTPSKPEYIYVNLDVKHTPGLGNGTIWGTCSSSTTDGIGKVNLKATYACHNGDISFESTVVCGETSERLEYYENYCYESNSTPELSSCCIQDVDGNFACEGEEFNFEDGKKYILVCNGGVEQVCPTDCTTTKPDDTYFSYTEHSTVSSCYCSVGCKNPYYEDTKTGDYSGICVFSEGGTVTRIDNSTMKCGEYTSCKSGYTKVSDSSLCDTNKAGCYEGEGTIIHDRCGDGFYCCKTECVKETIYDFVVDFAGSHSHTGDGEIFAGCDNSTGISSATIGATFGCPTQQKTFSGSVTCRIGGGAVKSFATYTNFCSGGATADQPGLITCSVTIDGKTYNQGDQFTYNNKTYKLSCGGDMEETCPYTMTEEICAQKCAPVNNTIPHKICSDGVTYYERCGDITCSAGQLCNKGKCEGGLYSANLMGSFGGGCPTGIGIEDLLGVTFAGGTKGDNSIYKENIPSGTTVSMSVNNNITYNDGKCLISFNGFTGQPNWMTEVSDSDSLNTIAGQISSNAFVTANFSCSGQCNTVIDYSPCNITNTCDPDGEVPLFREFGTALGDRCCCPAKWLENDKTPCDCCTDEIVENDCVYQETPTTCRNKCMFVPTLETDSCVRNGTTYYETCGLSRCLVGQTCNNGSCTGGDNFSWPTRAIVNVGYDCGIGYWNDRMCWMVVNNVSFVDDMGAMLVDTYVDFGSSLYICVRPDINNMAHAAMCGSYKSDGSYEADGDHFSYCDNENSGGGMCNRPNTITACNSATISPSTVSVTNPNTGETRSITMRVECEVGGGGLLDRN